MKITIPAQRGKPYTFQCLHPLALAVDKLLRPQYSCSCNGPALDISSNRWYNEHGCREHLWRSPILPFELSEWMDRFTAGNDCPAFELEIDIPAEYLV